MNLNGTSSCNTFKCFCCCCCWACDMSDEYRVIAVLSNCNEPIDFNFENDLSPQAITLVEALLQRRLIEDCLQFWVGTVQHIIRASQSILLIELYRILSHIMRMLYTFIFIRRTRLVSKKFGSITSGSSIRQSKVGFVGKLLPLSDNEFWAG